MSIPSYAEIVPSGELTDGDFDAMATACQETNFAIVRHVVSRKQERRMDREIYSLPRKGSWSSSDSDGDSENYARDIFTGVVRHNFPTTYSIMAGIAIGLANAAQRNDTPRVNMGEALELVSFMVNSYPPDGYISRHYDHNAGIVYVLNKTGIGEMELSDYWNEPLGSVLLEPGDMAILPAAVASYDQQHQAYHKVTNKTPLKQGGGLRTSVNAIFQAIDTPLRPD